MRPRIFLKTPNLRLPSHSSLGASKRIGLQVIYDYRLRSTLSPGHAAAKDGDVSSARQSMERRGPISKSNTTTCGSKPRRIVTTLDPSRLDCSCFMDISNLTRPRVFHSTSHGKRLLLALIYIWRDKHMLPFPSGTQGFLYFYTNPLDPSKPNLRFRVTKNSNPESFTQGTDLMYSPGLPFYVNLSRVLRSPSNEPLRKLLIQDGLIDEAHMAEIMLRPAYSHLKRRPIWPITRLNDPFTYSLSVKTYHLMICSPGSQRAQYNMLSPLRISYVPLFEKGSLECRFERSTLPEHAGKRVILMRLLKVLEPPVPISNPPPGADMTVPAEGELFTLHGRLWQRDVDRGDCPSGNIPVLRSLFDADDKQLSR